MRPGGDIQKELSSRELGVRVVEFMKLMRAQPLTAAEIRDALGWHENTIARWLREFEVNGLLIVERRKPSQSGRPAKTYALAPCWKGPT